MLTVVGAMLALDESLLDSVTITPPAGAALGSVTVTSLAKRRAAGEEITPKMIAEEAERGDQVARRVIMETAY